MNYFLQMQSGRLLRVVVEPDYESLSLKAARLIAACPASVLGLATGSTPIGIYAALVQMALSEQIDFSRTTSFNLDEYYPIPADSPKSYHSYMRKHLFDRLQWGKWHVPGGQQRRSEIILKDCAAYEKAIRQAGGIDLQLLGIGRTGHIGFNEPGTSIHSRTGLVNLSAITREDAAPNFGGLEQTPKQAVSMGLGTILEARRILLVASGAAKADIIHAAFCGLPRDDVPASLLQNHPAVKLYLDAAAAGRIAGALIPAAS